MHHQPEDTVRELGTMRPALRGDLRFTPQTSGGQPFYLVEDPLNSRFFRLGQVEYTFVSLLDGNTSIGEALRHLSRVMSGHCLSEHDAAGLCRWLLKMDLAQTFESSHATRLAKSAEAASDRRLSARWNPLQFRVPLGRPDHVFAALDTLLGWLHSRLAIAGWLVVVTIGAYRVFSDWERFTSSSQGIFAPDNWLWLAGCWFGLKVLHELSHGMVCKRYGGTVGELGILFVLFAPAAYVDVTSSWRFRSRWQLVHVAAAGIYVELLTAAIAALVWSNTGSGWLNSLCCNVIIMAGVTTLLYNANPLMKFDGYYILSDALGMPNLYVNGQQYLRYWARRYLFGVPATLPAWSRGTGTVIRLYGWTALMWRIVVCVSLTVAALTLFHGLGIALAGLAGVMWLGLPILRLAGYFLFGKPGEHPRRLRFLLLTSSAAAVCTAVFAYVPWLGAHSVPAVVEYSPYTVLRTTSAGFVCQIHVASGQLVEPGQLLVQLENRELARDLADLELQIRQSEIRGHVYEQKGELASEQAESEKREALLTQLAEKRVQVAHLGIRAPRSGKIVRRNLDTLLGTHLEVGDEIALLGDESHKELRLSVSQEDLAVFTRRVGEPVGINVPQRPSWESRLEKVIPRATLAPPHPALAATNGGPLPVKLASHSNAEASSNTCELLHPRFTAIVALTPTDSRRLNSGERATVTCRLRDESVGQHLYQAFSRWLRDRLTAGQQQDFRADR